MVPLIEAPPHLMRFRAEDWGGDTPAAREACWRAREAFIDAAEAPTTLGDSVDLIRLRMFERREGFPPPEFEPWRWYLPTPEEYRAERDRMRLRRAAAERAARGDRL